MTYEEASKVIRDTNSAYPAIVEAAAVITSTPESSYEDLIHCLRRGGHSAEIGATALYVRSKRPREDFSARSISTDVSDWMEWLLSHNLLRNRVA